MTMIDVGQGDALMVQFPNGRSVLIDAGGSGSSFDIGDRVVAPALWALGVRRLDRLAVTHPDLDHIGGAASVAAIFAPLEIWEGVPVPRDLNRTALHDLAAARRLPWRQARRDDRLELGAVTVDVLNPRTPDWERQRVRNDDSLVLRVRYGLVELLLTGDISAAIERELLADSGGGPPLRLLKVAHHGSRTSSSRTFLERYAPVAALISAGRGNTFGHPAPDVLAELGRVRARVFRTDRDGAVTVETDGRELRVRTWSGETWQARAWPAAPEP
jgi:competence protein ComEC